MKRLVVVGHAVVLAIGGEQVLNEIVGAQTEEVELLGQYGRQGRC